MLCGLLLGLGEAAAFPAYNKIIALNCGGEHRGRANSILISGALFGPGFGLLAGGFLMGRYGWRPFFIVLGLASMLWLIPWIKCMPEKHRAASRASAGIPNLWEFFQMRSAWGTCLGLFCSNYANYFLITWLPYFLVRERHFSMDGMAKIGSAAYLLGGVITPICGWLADHWIARGASPTLARKTFVGGGIACCGIFLGLAGWMESRYTAALIILGVASYSFMSSNLWAISQALAGPAAAGRWVGFQNFFGNLSGIFAPAITGFVVDRTGHFFWAFLIAAGVCLGSSASWIFLVGRVEPVVWGRKGQA